MIEIRLDRDLVLRCRDCHERRVLHLVNEVLLALADEAPTLLHVEIDVVAPEHHGLDVRRIDLCAAPGVRQKVRGVEEALKRGERDVDTNRVVLEGQEGEVETRIATEEELQRDVQTKSLAEWAGNEIGHGITVDTADHRIEGISLAGGRRELLPDLHPLAGLLVDFLFADLERDFLDQGVPDGIDITDRGVGEVLEGELRKEDIDVDPAEKVASARDETGDALAEICRTVEVHWLRLNGEVRIAPIDHLKEADLGIAGEEDILLPLCNQL